MKVLMCLMGLDIGGAETHVLELCRGLAKKGIDVYVASRGGVYVDELNECGIKHFTVPLHNKKPLNAIKSYKLLKNIIIDNKIDVVHAHARIPAFLCGLLAKNLHFAFVTSAHWIFNPSFPFNILTNWGKNTLAVSEDIKKYLVENYGLPPQQIKVTINGIDLEKFSPYVKYSEIAAEFDLNADEKRIVYISRMDVDRSLAAHKLIECAPYIVQTYPNARIIIVGGGNDFENVKAEAEMMNGQLKKNIIVLTNGRVDINKFIAASDIFIGVSRAALEGMAAGNPTILAGNEGYIGIFDKDKLQIAVDTNFTCRGCAETSTDMLKNDILKLLGVDKSTFDGISGFSREVVAQQYSVDRMVQDALDVYGIALKETKSKRGIDVLISGYYGYRNSGDDALLQAIVQNLRMIKPDIKIAVLSNNPRETAEIYGVKSIYRFNFMKIAVCLKRTKLLISGGGSLVQDITSSKSLMYYLWVIQTGIKNGARVMLYSNGIGPVKQEKNRRKATEILNQVDCITLREKRSASVLQELNVTLPEVLVTADPAFWLDSVSNEKTLEILKRYRLNEDEKYFVVSVRDWKYKDVGFEQKIADVCDEAYNRYGLRALLVPMQYPADRRVSQTIISKMKHKGKFVDCACNAEEILGIVKKAEFIIGMRLHTLIYAANVGVPVIGLEYDPKVRSVMEYMEQSYHIDILDIDINEVNGYIDDILKNKDEISKKLRDVSLEAKEKAFKTAQMAIDLLG